MSLKSLVPRSLRMGISSFLQKSLTSFRELKSENGLLRWEIDRLLEENQQLRQERQRLNPFSDLPPLESTEVHVYREVARREMLTKFQNVIRAAKEKGRVV